MSISRRIHTIVVLSITLVSIKNELFVLSISTKSESSTYFNHLLLDDCPIISEELNPIITVQHGDQIYNSSFEFDETTDVASEHRGFVFSISCSAHYPIQWIINYFFNGERNSRPSALHLQITRKFEKFEDPSTYAFQITSRMRYKNSFGFKNFSFTCSSTQRPNCLQRSLYTSFGNLKVESSNPSDADSQMTSTNKSGIKVNIIASSSWSDESINPLPENSIETHPPTICDYNLFYRNLGWNNFGLSCQFNNGSPGTVKVIYKCSNAISCEAFHRQNQSRFVENCVKSVGAWNKSSCEFCQERILPLSQGFLSCISEDSHSHQAEEKLVFFFTSIPQESSQEEIGGYFTQLYFDMDHAEPDEMMSLGKITSKVALGDQISIVCNVSTYYFSGGTRIALKYAESDELVFLKSIAVPLYLETSDVTHSFGTVHESNIPITTDTIEKIYCFAPFWNSFLWGNKSQSITVEDNSSSHIFIAISATLFVTTVACGVLFAIFWIKILRQRLSKFGKLLSPQEIEEFRRYQTTNDSENDRLSLNPPNDYECIHPGIQACYNASLEIKREHLLLDETAVLGKGHFGIVLKGVLNDVKKNQRLDVAVKTIKTKTDVNALKSLLSELKIMASVGKHPNVVNLVGACTKRIEKGEIYIAVEFCAKGNLQIFLREHRDKFKNQMQNDILIVETLYSVRKSVSDDIVCTLDLVKWAWEISKGMEFLSSKKMIHSDLATRNILLTIDNVAKVSDFGLSRQLVDYYYVKEESSPLPWKWMAIESLRDMKFSIQSDVWSYGIAVWEIFSLAAIPYIGCNWSAEFVVSLVSGNRLGKPQYATSEMYDLMRECWKEDPSERPSFSTIKNFFEDVITRCSSQDYMQIDLQSQIQSIGINNEDNNMLHLLPMTPTIDISDYDEGEDEVFD